VNAVRTICFLSIMGTGLAAVAQDHGAGHGGQGSSYAGQHKREIKALSMEEQRGWLEGQGMGLARAAELNGYPGPMHALELAGALRLSSEQMAATRDLMHRHKAEARALGMRLVEAERRLDASFRDKQANESDVERLTAEIGQLQASIRASHLRTHLAQYRLLSAEQVAEYNRLRGYTR
jgi:Spy/CpxP family protein refolding chaperone